MGRRKWRSYRRVELAKLSKAHGKTLPVAFKVAVIKGYSTWSGESMGLDADNVIPNPCHDLFPTSIPITPMYTLLGISRHALVT